jgi:hypothetical protein
MNAQSQNKKIWEALKRGRRLTSAAVVKLTGSTAPATRMSETQKQYGFRAERQWIKRNGKRFLEYWL